MTDTKKYERLTDYPLRDVVEVPSTYGRTFVHVSLSLSLGHTSGAINWNKAIDSTAIEVVSVIVDEWRQISITGECVHRKSSLRWRLFDIQTVLTYHSPPMYSLREATFPKLEVGHHLLIDSVRITSLSVLRCARSGINRSDSTYIRKRSVDIIFFFLFE